jgi:hypothetical protein
MREETNRISKGSATKKRKAKKEAKESKSSGQANGQLVLVG